MGQFAIVHAVRVEDAARADGSRRGAGERDGEATAVVTVNENGTGAHEAVTRTMKFRKLRANSSLTRTRRGNKTRALPTRLCVPFPPSSVLLSFCAFEVCDRLVDEK